MRISRAGKFLWTAVACGALLAAGYGMTACGNGGSGTVTGMSQLTTTITDPAECSAAVGGSYDAVYVTITDVQANVNGSASASGSGWVDLTPGLKPTQINLLGSEASGGCFLAKLGDNLEVQAGNYHQIRLVLGSNTSTALTTNACSANGVSGVNCIEYKNKAGNDTWSALTTPSAQQTGIKIIPSQLSGGSLNLAAGKTEDLVINFQTCESIVQAGNSGQFVLQPVLNAGQVSTSSSTINGTVTDSAGNPITGNVLVSLEQPDANGVDRIKYSTRAAADGTFSFCSLLQGQTSGTYDVVVSAYNPSSSVAYETAVETGVQIGDTTGTIKLSPSTISTATLTGMATTVNSSSTGVSTLMNFYPLEANPVTTSSTKYFTVPLLQTPTNDQAFLPQATTTGPTYTDPAGTVTTCPTNTDCATFSMTVPQSGISVYNYSSSGPTPAAATYSTLLGSYTVDAQAWEVSSPSTADCTTPELMTAPATTISAGTATDQPTAVITTTQALDFTGCQ